MSSSITTTLTVGVGLAVVPAVADGELGSVMGSMLLNVHVPTTHTTSLYVLTIDRILFVLGVRCTM